MKQLALALIVAVSLTGCASLRNADGTLNVVKILNDASWGLAAACTQDGWVPADACVFGQATFNLAVAAAMKDRATAVLAARQVLKDAEARLTIDSKLRPYFDAAIALLTV